MTQILNTNADEELVRTESTPAVPATPAPVAPSGKPVLSLSSLKITKPRTAKDIARAIAQGRVADLKLD
jgi:hypothetical protein